MHLPQQGLFADLELGVGSVSLDDDFAACDPAVQLAVLRDWQRGLAQAQAAAAQRLFDDLSAARPDLSRTARLAHWREACAALGLTPPEPPRRAG